jgi:diguanylate cyclase (GGDEF)-like protein/PAS domain S-box-containing protein
MIFRSIKTRIFWSHIVAILLVNIVLGGLTYRFLVDKLITTEKKNLEFIAGHMVEMLRHNVLRKEEILGRIATGREVVDYLDTYRDLALAEYLAGFQKELPQISFLNRQGGEEVKVKDGENVEVLATTYDREMLDRSLASPNEVEIVFDSEVDGKHSSLLYLALSTYSYFGDVYGGTLLAAVPYSNLLHEVASTHIHSGGYFVLWGEGQDDIFVQESGHAHRHTKDAILRIATSHEDGKKFLDLAGREIHFSQAEILGTESMVVYLPIDEFQLNLVITLPHEKITTQLGHLRNQAVVVFLGLCLVAAFLSYLLAKTITRPISTLTRVTREIAADRHDTQGLATIKNRKDEVGVLVSSFQTMIDSLWSTMVSRAYVDSIFAAMSESVLVIAETGEIRRVNKSACQLLGYREEELLGLTIGDIFAEGLQTPDFIGHLLQKDVWQETGYRHKDGSVVAVLFSCSSLVREGGYKETVCVASDISSLKKARAAFEENEYYLKALMKSLPSGLLVIDAENRMVIDVNPSACMLFQCSREKLIGHVCFELIKPVGGEDEWPPVVTADKPIINMECELLPPDAPRVPVVMSVQAITLRDSLIYISSIVDITESKKVMGALKESEEKLRILSNTDELTGLLNRRGFMALVEKQLQIYARKKRVAYLLFADIDNLKEINDAHGHLAGDEMIRRTARVLGDVCRKADIIGRLGGGEFAVLLTDAEGEQAIVNRLEARIIQCNDEPGDCARLSLSVGVVSCDGGDQGAPCQLDTILSLADAKMYALKKRRKKQDSPAPAD